MVYWCSGVPGSTSGRQAAALARGSLRAARAQRGHPSHHPVRAVLTGGGALRRPMRPALHRTDAIAGFEPSFLPLFLIGTTTTGTIDPRAAMSSRPNPHCRARTNERDDATTLRRVLLHFAIGWPRGEGARRSLAGRRRRPQGA
jgi:hypothetical protein